MAKLSDLFVGLLFAGTAVIVGLAVMMSGDHVAKSEFQPRLAIEKSVKPCTDIPDGGYGIINNTAAPLTVTIQSGDQTWVKNFVVPAKSTLK